VPRRCLQRVKIPRYSEEVDGGSQGDECNIAVSSDQGSIQKVSLDKDDGGSTLTEKFEAETGQEVPQRTGSQEGSITETTPTHDQPQASQEKPGNCVCSEETTGQDLSSPLHPLPPPDFNALTPSQTSFSGDATSSTQTTSNDVSGTSQSLPFSPPPHGDLLASSERVASYQDSSSSIGSSRSLLPSLPPPPPIPANHLQGFGLSSSLHSLPTTFSPSNTPVMNPHKFLGYNPMMVCEHSDGGLGPGLEPHDGGGGPQ
jgi:hypothetical protein